MSNPHKPSFRQDALEKLFSLTAGSAYLIMRLCSDLVQYLNERKALVATCGVVDDFLRRKVFGSNRKTESIAFEPQLMERGHEELDNDNLRILKRIAGISATGKAVKPSDISFEDLSCEEAERLMDRLENWDVLERKDGCGSLVRHLKNDGLWPIWRSTTSAPRSA